METGQLVTAAYARKLACEAGIIPMVLNGKSVVLDQGREKRFHTKAQRIALNVRDQGCTALGCDWPAWLCHAHHDIPWSQGGHTDRRHRPAAVPATSRLRPLTDVRR